MRCMPWPRRCRRSCAWVRRRGLTRPGMVWCGTRYTRHRSCPSKVWRPMPAHPLLRTVSLDRNFLPAAHRQPIPALRRAGAEDFALWSKPQPGDRRAGAHRRRPGPRAQPAFLNPELALREFVEPALEGLGSKVGALVFQISPCRWRCWIACRRCWSSCARCYKPCHPWPAGHLMG